MTTLQISDQDFTNWKNAADTAMRALETIGAPPSGDYGEAAEIVNSENSAWDTSSTTYYTEVDALLTLVRTIQDNFATADQMGA